MIPVRIAKESRIVSGTSDTIVVHAGSSVVHVLPEIPVPLLQAASVLRRLAS